MHSFSSRIKQSSDVGAALWSVVSEAGQLLQEVPDVLNMPCRGTNKGEHLWPTPRWAKNGQPGIWLDLIAHTYTKSGHQINKKQTNIHMGNGWSCKNMEYSDVQQTHGHGHSHENTADMKSMCLVALQIAAKWFRHSSINNAHSSSWLRL